MVVSRPETPITVDASPNEGPDHIVDAKTTKPLMKKRTRRGRSYMKPCRKEHHHQPSGSRMRVLFILPSQIDDTRTFSVGNETSGNRVMTLVDRKTWSSGCSREMCLECVTISASMRHGEDGTYTMSNSRFAACRSFE